MRRRTTAYGGVHTENDGRTLSVNCVDGHDEPRPSPHPPPTLRNRTTCWPRCRPWSASGSTRTCGSWRCRLARCCTSPATSSANVYFPTDCIVSLLYVMESGASAEISVVGNEGLIGVALFMGGETTPSRAIVQSAGHAYRLDRPTAQGRVPSQRRPADPAAALHADADHADGADRRVQSASFGGPAIVPLAAAVARRLVVQRTGHDAGTHRQHARRAPRGRHRGGRQAPEARRHPLQPRAASPCWTGRTWSGCAASAMGW